MHNNFYKIFAFQTGLLHGEPFYHKYKNEYSQQGKRLHDTYIKSITILSG